MCERGSRAADHSAPCTLVTVPTGNGWKPQGNGVREEGTATAGGKHPWNDRQNPLPGLLHGRKRHPLTESDHDGGRPEQVGVGQTDFRIRKPGK